MFYQLRLFISLLAIIINASTASITAITAETGQHNESAYSSEESNPEPELEVCDGKTVTENCKGEDGLKYQKYIFHEAKPEETKKVEHPETPAKTHTVYHEPVYGTRIVRDCIRTNISYKKGTCALSRCRDGSYSGSTGRGTCSYHGGVLYDGGPWYEDHEEEYLIKEGWTETIIDEPAHPAWTETVVISPAIPEFYEKILDE